MDKKNRRWKPAGHSSWTRHSNASTAGTFETFVDARTGKNKSYTLVDAGLSAFSVFFMQSHSFLEYQRTLEQAHGENNASRSVCIHSTNRPINETLNPAAASRCLCYTMQSRSRPLDLGRRPAHSGGFSSFP